MISSLSIFFGLLALLLTAIGLYGTLAYSVTRRTNEIGIHMALGARGRDVICMILAESTLMVLVGFLIAIPAVLAAGSVIASQLFGVKPSDPLTIAFAITVMLGVAVAASLLPACRAARIDPIIALRYE